MERCVLHYLNQTLNDFLHNRQHGFRRGRSCETQLYTTYHELAKTKETMKTTHVVIFDVKKVFDKVCHVLLMEKLKLIPKIHSILVNWIQKFLTHRNQKVVIERNFFSELEVTSEVPQD